MPRRDQAAKAAERRAQAFELRKAGASYRSIARALSVNERSTRRYIKHVLDELKRETLNQAADYRALQLERLNDLLFADWKAARAGDLQAQDRVLKIMEREAKLLGLDLDKARLDLGVGVQVLIREVHGSGLRELG